MDGWVYLFCISVHYIMMTGSKYIFYFDFFYFIYMQLVILVHVNVV